MICYMGGRHERLATARLRTQQYQSIGKVVVRRSRVRRFPSRIKKWAEKSLDRLIKLEIKKEHLFVEGIRSGHDVFLV